ncbi:LEAF RUST 10 DISEASE-RESISTANCE LOCUS RECEPTOR-LIKE PROTEIN KINASE-like 2.4 [Pistacia vera]|uniref:LEAF RUST 10 DISEASE-RESISTANCE LOCUS RECEPTOR-LIKE PROTEIN KINASE-like 2.4 n=1 Tax=Pistacia vera TaxID=55513 RepID=UPI001263BDA7|nr:LEAF RUST 10 DISEASE-RESISTANCE LOCUS RECEPTOR-LIKE PROTEIN KINASE-like 2.4 [Pistacia vera]
MTSFKLFSSSPFLCALGFLILVLVNIQLSLSNPGSFEDCRLQFTCGNITAGYPFWGVEGTQYGRPELCGHMGLELYCKEDTTFIMINHVEYCVLNISESAKVLNIARQDYLSGICPYDGLVNTTFESTLFEYSPRYEKFTLRYGVPRGQIFCSIEEMEKNFNYTDGLISTLGSGFMNFSVTVPVLKTFLEEANRSLSVVEEALKQGFEVKWKVNGMENCSKCIQSHGSCGPGPPGLWNQPICYCPPQSFLLQDQRVCSTLPPPKGPPDTSDERKKKTTPPKAVIGVAVATCVVGLGIVLILSILLIVGRGRFWKKKTENNKTVEGFIKNYGSLAPRRYSYYDVKKMTTSFRDKLGQGGFGDVYKGILSDGRLVAVKVLKESKGNGEEFINEVVSMSRTSHVNIVASLGFCFEKKKRALIYEFMSNGSLEKFIYDNEPSSVTRKLEWETVSHIVVGIARGLEYLHRRCNIRIVHFDIKPHNILLDEDFCPKISDFGLAKQSNTKESIIPMSGARGTAGYIAPEVFCRNFGGVSHKSDVYSYGMMVLEMIGRRKNIDVRVSHMSQIYFPHWIHKYVESGNDLKLHGVSTEEEKDIVKKMILAGLWCIQTIPSDRPSMTKVVEMLEGSLENLEVPPKPYLSSPTRSPQHSSPTSST